MNLYEVKQTVLFTRTPSEETQIQMPPMERHLQFVMLSSDQAVVIDLCERGKVERPVEGLTGGSVGSIKTADYTVTLIKENATKDDEEAYRDLLKTA